MEDALILSIIFGFTTLMFVIGYKMLKLKYSHENGSNDEAFNRLAKAFMQHKKDMERRVENLEAIVVEEDETTKGKKSKSTAQIEAPELNEGSLSNDLNKNKNRIRS